MHIVQDHISYPWLPLCTIEMLEEGDGHQAGAVITILHYVGTTVREL